MVRGRPLLAVELAAGALTVLLHPCHTNTLVLALLAGHVAYCTIAPRPGIRFLLPLAGTAGVKALAALGKVTGNAAELDYFPFLLVGTMWALSAAGTPGQKRGSAYLVGVMLVGFAAASLGFLALWLLDDTVPPLAPLLGVRIGTRFSRLHLAAVGTAASALFLVLWNVFATRARAGSEKVLAYTDGYLACRRDLSRLSRRWSC